MRAAWKVVPLMVVLAGCAQPDSGRSAEEMIVAPAATPASVSPPGGDVQTGVGYVGSGVEPVAQKVEVKEIDPSAPVRLRVTGIGTVPSSRSLTASQKRLLSVRAAKLDAFRAIAEQVQGMKLVGSSSVANMVSVSDSFRTYVDAYLRGVKIVSTSIKPDGSSEVVAEIVLDKDFYRAFKSTLQQSGSVMKASKQVGAQGLQCGADSCASSPYGGNFYNAQ
jgi:outer membrane protein FlgP